MRTREEIEKQVKGLSEGAQGAPASRLTLRDNINLELLLDIREILKSLSATINMPNVEPLGEEETD